MYAVSCGMCSLQTKEAPTKATMFAFLTLIHRRVILIYNFPINIFLMSILGREYIFGFFSIGALRKIYTESSLQDSKQLLLKEGKY